MDILDILDIRTIKPTLTQGEEIGDTSAKIITNNSLPDKIRKKFIHRFTDIESVASQTAQQQDIRIEYKSLHKFRSDW